MLGTIIAYGIIVYLVLGFIVMFLRLFGLMGKTKKRKPIDVRMR